MPARTTAPRVIAVVITYCPEDDCRVLIDSLMRQCDGVVVIDNGSEAASVAALVSACRYSGAEFIALSQNVGIAAAQNSGIERARELGATHVLLSDDDSLPPDDMVSSLLEPFDRGDSVAAVGPLPTENKPGGDQLVYQDRGWSPKRATKAELDTDLLEVPFLIASGCLVSIAALDMVGGMDSSLFIDHVDLEWGLRARRAGYKLYCAPRVSLLHSLGDETIKLPGRDQPVHVHSPVRNYYILRNTLLLVRRDIMPWRWRVRYTYWATKYLLFNSLYVDRLAERRRMLVRALHDSLRGRRGRFEPRLRREK